MESEVFEIDSWAAFRLSWPGAAPSRRAPAPAAKGLRSLIARFRRGSACTGWPVQLAAPGPETAPPLPRVKLTGGPLD